MVKHAAAGTAVVLALAMLTLADGQVARADQWCGPGFHSTGWGDNGDGIINVGDNFYCVPDPTPTPPTTTKPKPAPTSPTTTTVLATTTTAGTTTTTDPCMPDKTIDACDQDDDGLTNAQEDAKGTDPTDADTDGDGVLDGKDRDNTTPADMTVDAFGVAVAAVTDSTSTTVASGSSDESSSSTGLIAGLVAGAAVLAGLLLLVTFKRRRKDDGG